MGQTGISFLISAIFGGIYGSGRFLRLFIGFGGLFYGSFRVFRVSVLYGVGRRVFSGFIRVFVVFHRFSGGFFRLVEVLRGNRVAEYAVTVLESLLRGMRHEFAEGLVRPHLCVHRMGDYGYVRTVYSERGKSKGAKKEGRSPLGLHLVLEFLTGVRR